METYIYLSTTDKKALIKLAESKQLSISTTAGIIINHLSPLCNAWFNNYISKGEKMIHIKVKPTEQSKNLINAMNSTNCLYCFFNKPIVKNQKVNWPMIFRKIQSEMDKTEDPNRFKNQEIRIAYRLKAGKF